ncbi:MULTISPECIES: KOW domain-containing RNA-binding protein [Thermoanaerobacterium]|uniref:Ribosomal protein L14E/L6E/L27E n=1 Tax=Thermoanaerobacterium butyriciformans TaxID=1702242 RepID=A0ABS4NFQ9_9THEO|nr:MULTISPECIES: KOW domain-containing RNA-binding protein [Thermoanaerobacterium]MBP2071989.1 ribosomal protein L14E/L6E/L27E [Thermoanaerobacterium butyriciformans]MCP2241071.1 ribosomal protein L14E/L6E/L27E [Thermoanaerobacterium thermosaccharolyticum]
MDDTSIGRIVKSKAGRDKDRIFIIVGVADEKHVLIADGDLRKIEKPKKKKLIHLQKYNEVDETIREKILKGETVTNAEIKNALKQFKCGE